MRRRLMIQAFRGIWGWLRRTYWASAVHKSRRLRATPYQVQESRDMNGLDRETELARLRNGGCSDLPPGRLEPFTLEVRCNSNAYEVLTRVREVLLTILQQAPARWPSL